MKFSFQKITFHTHTNSKKQKEERILISGVESVGSINKNATRSFQTALLVPSISPSDFDVSNICKVRYIVQVSEGGLRPSNYEINILTTTCSFSSFKVSGKVPGCHRDCMVEIPVIIGSYPFADDQTKQGYTADPSTGGYIFPVSSGSGPAGTFDAPTAPTGYPNVYPQLDYSVVSPDSSTALLRTTPNSTLPSFPLQ